MEAMKILGKEFFERSSLEVAENLLGKFLVVSSTIASSQGKKKKIIQKYLITETEAYGGIEDLASHASKGRTARTEIMFGKPGIFYVYLVYGMYHMLNVVTGKKGHPGGVLIRGVEKIEGPGKLTKKLGIDKKFNGRPATPKTGIWFVEPSLKSEKTANIESKSFVIKKTPRIGVSYAGPIWSKKLWRFLYVSTNSG